MSGPARLDAVAGEEVAAAIGRAARGNPLLGIGIGPHPYLPADRLCAAGGAPEGEPAPAAGLVDAVAAWAGTSERRVASSLAVLGYSARLVGPSLAVLLRGRILFDARPTRVQYLYRPEHGFRLALPAPNGWRGHPDSLVTRWCEDIVEDHLHGLIGAVRAVAPVAVGLLWGNVASGIAGTLRAIANSGGPSLDACRATGLQLLEHGPLRGSGAFNVHNGQLGFMRTSCCLYYRLDGGGTCGDCPLGPVTGRSPSYHPTPRLPDSR